MKLLIISILLSCSAYAVTPLDMKVGYWKYETQLGKNPMLKKAMAGLSNLPKAQREMIMKKMNLSTAGNSEFYKCFTKKDLENIIDKIVESKKEDKKGCKMVINKSTKNVYDAKRKCKDGKGDMDFSIKMLNNKEGITIMKMAMTPVPMKSKMTWVSSNCPKKK